ncbi:RNA-binding S4 domain-containing protein [soil metagenome]
MRFYKTRTQATQACDLNRVSVSGQTVKPSKHIKVGEKIELKWGGGLKRTIEVIQLTEKRLGAKLVVEYYKDHTPPKEIDDFKARVARAAAYRDPGAGRPTKKDRRDMDDFLDAVDDLFE